MPHLSGKKKDPPHEALFWRKGNGQAWAVRSGTLKLLEASGKREFFDLSADLGEKESTLEDHEEEAAHLEKLYAAWNASNKPPSFPSFRDYHKMKNRFYMDLPAESGGAVNP